MKEKMLHFEIFILIFTISFVGFFSVTLFSWSGHEAYTYLVVSSLKKYVELDKLIPITQYSYKETRVYNTKYYYTDDYAGQRKFFDPLGDGVFPPDPKPVENKLPIWQILTIYAQFPDFGMDEELNLSPLQGLIGNSQGVRHMRYKLGIIEAFEGDKSFLYFVKMSKEALAKNDEYWAYRFLSYSLHYMQDLFQPYHVSPGTFWEVIIGMFNKKTMTMLNNAHYVYDNYLLYLIYYSKNSEEIRNLIKNTPPRSVSSNTEKLINEVMAYSYSKFPLVHSELKKAAGEKLYEKVLDIEEMKKLEEEGKLDNLYKITKEIIVKMTSTMKGFLLDYFKSNLK